MRTKVGLIVLALTSVLLVPITTQFANAAMSYPSAPRDVNQTAIEGGIRVTWTVPADITAGLTGYQIEYSTSGTEGSWTTSGSVSSGTLSYDLLGLAANPTYVRVAGKNGAIVGTYGYPWKAIYSTSALRRDPDGNITYDPGFQLASVGGQASNTFQSATFTRVKYRMQATISGVSNYVESDFYKWTYGGATGSTSRTTEPTISGIAIPGAGVGQQLLVQANVSDLNVFSDASAVTKISSGKGRLEIWQWDYEKTTSGLSDPGTSSTYDSDDTPSSNNGYGSFQVHDLTNGKTVFAWNRTNSSYSLHAEVGFGSNTGDHPDWTFCSEGGTKGSCPEPSVFSLKIYINPAITPLVDNGPPTVSRLDAKTVIKSGDTISVQSTEIGTVYLVQDSIAVSSVESITSAAVNVRNSLSITSANTATTFTTSGLADGTYKLYAADAVKKLSAPIIGTVRIDSTAPTSSTISVNSSGESILINVSETVTISNFVSGAYTVSDSGSAMSVTSASISGQIITLNLSRAIPAGAYVTFSYSPSAVALSGRWVDAAGNQMGAVSLRSITNNSSTPISVTLTVPITLSKGASTTISVSVSVAGKVTFTLANKRIAGCFNKAATGATPITVSCTFKPALTARQTIKATLVPTLNSYPATSSSVERFILKRATLR